MTQFPWSTLRLRPELSLAWLGLSLAACASAGPWGFARDYTPISSESAAAEGVHEYDPVMAGRRFHEWTNKRISVFGVVKKLEEVSGRTRLELGIRVLQDRNLCDTASEDSCRVTVSEHEFAVLHAFVDLKPEDRAGEHRVLPGSLVRVIGLIQKAPDENSGGGAVLDGSYHRHWPHKYFVTTADRDYMLR
jgi:hypothetical protein